LLPHRQRRLSRRLARLVDPAEYPLFAVPVADGLRYDDRLLPSGSARTRIAAPPRPFASAGERVAWQRATEAGLRGTPYIRPGGIFSWPGSLSLWVVQHSRLPSPAGRFGRAMRVQRSTRREGLSTIARKTTPPARDRPMPCSSPLSRTIARGSTRSCN